MTSYTTRSTSPNGEAIIPDTIMRTSPEPFDSENPSLNPFPSTSSKAVGQQQQQQQQQVFPPSHYKSEPVPAPGGNRGTIRQNSMPIHHHIAPVLGAPFMRADGLVYRGHLVHRYTDGTESPVPVELKRLGDGSVISRTFTPVDPQIML